VAGEAVSYLCFMRDLARLIIQHYERHALAWDADRRRSAWNDKLWHERFMAHLPRPARVLDLGCGSGWPVARHLAQSGLRVTGVDSSPTLISLCRRRLPDHHWIVADMRTLSLACRFEGILAWDSYFHLDHDDQRRMFGVFAAHAKPGAILMFNAGPRRGEAIGNYRGDPLYHASLATSEYRRLLGQSGFEPIAHVRNDACAGGRTVWLARARGRLIARSLANAVGDANGLAKGTFRAAAAPRERPRSGAHGEGITERGPRKTEATLTNGPAGRVVSHVAGVMLQLVSRSRPDCPYAGRPARDRLS